MFKIFIYMKYIGFLLKSLRINVLNTILLTSLYDHNKMIKITIFKTSTVFQKQLLEQQTA